MKIKVVTVGKVKEKYLQKGIAEFLKRLQPFAHVQILSVPDVKVQKGQKVNFATMKEAEGLWRCVSPERDFVIVLDEKGDDYTSESFAKELEKWQQKGKTITFIIGGPNGLHDSIKEKAHAKMRLSSLTFTHEMAQYIFVEQLYRAFMINAGREYHKS